MAGSARRDRPGDSAARGLQRVASPWMPACSQLPLCSEGVEGAARRAGKSVDELWPDWICIGKHSIGLVWKSAHQETAAALFCRGKKKLALDEPASTVHPNVIHVFANTATEL